MPRGVPNQRVESLEPPQIPNLSIEEIQAGVHKQPIKDDVDHVAVALKMEEAEMEAFMHEKVTVEMGPGTPGRFAVPLTVNDQTVYAWFGKRQILQRKFVEVLINARTTDYNQWSNPQNPADSRPVPTTSNSFPFAIVEDTPKGREWYRNLMSKLG